MMIKLLLALCVFSFLEVSGQNDSIIVKNKKEYCNPSLVGMSRAKAFSVGYERVFDTEISSTSRDTSIGSSNSVIDRNNRFEIKLKFPMWIKPRLKVIGGFRYEFQEFVFKDKQNLDYDFYRNISDRHLQSIGLNISVLKPLNEISYFGLHATGDLNGDYNSKHLPSSSFIKYSISAVYGWKRCPTKTTGVGIYINYALGRRSVFPVVIYNNTFSKRWGLEMIFPANARIRYNVSKKTLLFAGYEVEGASYNLGIDSPPLAKYPTLQLRKSNVKLKLEFEQEIYDFLWIGIAAGIRQPLGFNVTERGDKGPAISLTNLRISEGERLINTRLSAAPYIEFIVFLVPPRKLEDRVLNRE
ncbi:MAG TPA: DUF6268 family outer membrane beta-barrel protein [Cytophagaceae bacterium]|jgi:hypothetical protein